MPTLVAVERTAPRTEIARVLRALADGVEAGSTRLDPDGENLAVSLPERFEYEVELETGDEGTDESTAPDEGGVEVELEVELEWLAGDGQDVEVPESEHDDADAASSDGVDDGSDADDDGTDDGSGEGSAGGDATTGRGGPTGGSDTAGNASTALPVRPPELPDSAARFELFRDRADEWRWRLVHDNGNVIADSGEGYGRKGGARNGLESVRTNAAAADVVEVSGEGD